MAPLQHKTSESLPRGILEKPYILKDLSIFVKFWFLNFYLFWTKIWLSRFPPISGFYQNCNQIAPQTPLQKLKNFKLEWNLKFLLGGSLVTSNLCVLTHWDFGTTSFFWNIWVFLVKSLFFKSHLSCTQIWLSPWFPSISCFCQYWNQIVPQNPLQTPKIFKLWWNLKICSAGFLATSNFCVFTERDFRKTSYSERFEFFAEILIF